MNAPSALMIATATVALLVAPSTGSACSLMPRRLTSAQIKQQARDDFRRAGAVIDAEVIQPMRFGAEWKPGLIPFAYLRALKVYKGRVDSSMVPVVYLTTCDIGLIAKGEKLRVLLSGEGVFQAELTMNGGGILDLSKYNAEIDRLVGKPRSAALAHFPGVLPTPRR